MTCVGTKATKPVIWILFLFLCVVIESLCTSLFLPLFDKRYTSLIYVISGLLIAIVPIIRPKKENFRAPHSIWYFAFLLIFCYFLIKWVTLVFPEILIAHPLDYKHADMLPVIQTMNERLLHGDYIFDPIGYIWEGTIPIYLPGMWIPFLPAIYFDFDMRWIPIAAILMGLIGWIIWGSKRKKIGIARLLIIVPICIIMYHYLHRNTIFFPRTQEGLTIGYYLALALSIWKRKPFLIGIFVGLCLLSRYAFIGWLGLFVWFLLDYESVKYRVKVLISAGAIMVCLLLVGQGYKHIPTYIKLQSIYAEAISDPVNEIKYRPLIRNSLGLAKYFPYECMPIMHYVGILLSLILPLVFYSWAKRKGYVQINSPLFLICSLKFSLVIFYNLLVIPYLYLFLTSTFLSVGVFSAYLVGKESLSLQ